MAITAVGAFVFLGGEYMTREEKEKYNEPELLRDILQRTLKDMKFRLD